MSQMECVFAKSKLKLVRGGVKRRKIPCIVLLKKALQASQEATP